MNFIIDNKQLITTELYKQKMSVMQSKAVFEYLKNQQIPTSDKIIIIDELLKRLNENKLNLL